MTNPTAELAQAIGCHRAGDLVGAERLYGQVLAADPDNPSAAGNLSLLLANTGRPADAAALLKKLIAKFPDDGRLHYSAATLFRRIGNLPETIHHLRRAAVAGAEHLDVQVEIVRNLGSIGCLDDARDIAVQAAARFPQSAALPVQFGAVLATAGFVEEAELQFNLALSLHPEMPLALYNLARIADGRSEFGTALDFYRRALSADTGGTLPPVILGDLEIKDGLVAEAVQSHEEWLAAHPSDHVVLSGRLLTAQYEPDATPEKLLTLHKRWDALAAQQPRIRSANMPCPADADRRLRLGFVSGDLTAHPVGYFMVRVLESLNPAAFETYAYSEAVPDAVITPRMKRAVPHWRDTAGWTDDGLASRIDSDRIDILVDLAGHTTPSRLMAFARRPAPVQVTWVGYPGTTGLSTMDALIADRFVVPPGEEACYAERVIRLPNSFLCYDPPADAPPVSPLPTAGGGGTFGSFHYPAKINAGVVKLWSRVLKARPGSRIQFVYRAYERPVVQDRIRGWFSKEGITADRIGFCGHLPRADYLRAFDAIDLMLDPFPFCGGTTTCDSMWMGVPVVTLIGRTFAGRQSESFLSAVGLPELVAANHDDYVDIASNLCGRDPGRLATLRATLRARMAASPLCDGARFARDVEVVFRSLWRARCEGRSGGDRN